VGEFELALADLVALELFVDAADLGSLSAAARRHRISQPAASESLRRLERRLGVTLLVRGPRGSSPTAEGERLAASARGVLAALARFSAEADAVRAGVRSQVRVAASYTNAEYVLPVRIAAFGASHPDVAVRLTVANSDEVSAMVRSGRADVGFIEGPSDLTGLRTRRIGRDELAVVVAPAHPWAARDTLTAAELTATPLLLRERESGTRRTYEAAAARVGREVVEPYGVMTSTEALKAAVRAGLGATVVSRLTVRDELGSGSLVAVPVAGLNLVRDLSAVWPAGRRNPRAAELIRTVATTAP
jgi:DNA-binding transcriptional LysR family regulator